MQRVEKRNMGNDKREKEIFLKETYNWRHIPHGDAVSPYRETVNKSLV